MNHFKHLIFILLIAISNAKASTGLEDLMAGTHITAGWIIRAKAILPTLAVSPEFQGDINLIVNMLDSAPSEALTHIVNWFNGFVDAAEGTEGQRYKAAISAIFNPST